MGIADLYQYVLLFVLIGMVLGIGILVLDKFMATTGMTTSSIDAINGTIQALKPVSTDWLPIIITVAVLSVILTLIVGAFVSRAGKR